MPEYILNTCESSASSKISITSISFQWSLIKPNQTLYVPFHHDVVYVFSLFEFAVISDCYFISFFRKTEPVRVTSENKQWCNDLLFSKDETECRLTVSVSTKQCPDLKVITWCYNTGRYKMDINMDWEDVKTRLKCNQKCNFILFLQGFYGSSGKPLSWK